MPADHQPDNALDSIEVRFQGLAGQFTAAAAQARTLASAENVSRLLWLAHGEGHLTDADA
ncbi:hypothetical protein [Rhodoblastus sp.]|uniref:hypothetical protein n=1 Tax=Rhodoblastus sp. TaxID=1962975 RepID=UPI003F9E66B3